MVNTMTRRRGLERPGCSRQRALVGNIGCEFQSCQWPSITGNAKLYRGKPSVHGLARVLIEPIVYRSRARTVERASPLAVCSSVFQLAECIFISPFPRHCLRCLAIGPSRRNDVRVPPLNRPLARDAAPGWCRRSRTSPPGLCSWTRSWWRRNGAGCTSIGARWSGRRRNRLTVSTLCFDRFRDLALHISAGMR